MWYYIVVERIKEIKKKEVIEMLIEDFMNELNHDNGIYEDIDEDTLLNSYTRMFVNRDNQVYYGMIVNYYGDTQVVNLVTGNYGFWNYENNKLEKQGTMKVTYLMKDMNRMLLDDYDYDDIIEHI